MDSIKELFRPHRLDENQWEKPITWGDLKGLLSTFSEDQLQLPVYFWGEEIGGAVYSVSELKEDFVNVSGEGCEPISAYIKDPYYKDDIDDIKSDICYPTGSILFNVNFFPPLDDTAPKSVDDQT